jgi:hypothetical protein
MEAAMLKIEPKLHKVKNYGNLEKLKEKIISKTLKKDLLISTKFWTYSS